MTHPRLIKSLIAYAAACLLLSDSNAGLVTGAIMDADTGKPVAARLYIQNATGEWFFAESGSPECIAVRYAKTNWVNARAVEVHTTLSAHPFRVELPPGRYTVTTERGKEYHPLTQEVLVGNQPLELKIKLRRWVKMAARGWFSGDGHVHRSLSELPTLLLAEDLNVALPQSYWAIQDKTRPTPSNKFFGFQSSATTNEASNDLEISPSLIKADATHVIWPLNTEYEIFKVGDAMQNLGAVFILNHKEPFKLGAPPMRPIAEEARRQGALLDMDKCNWNWSMMLPPIMNIDLYELANNHLWRAEYAFTNFNVPAPAFMNLPDDGRSGGERDWINYTFNSYYALLDCGFRMRPTAGTASGVHPVPPGFGRVYVHCPRGFTYERWIKGLGEGRSFVTTGPMLLAEINGEVPGGKFQLTPGRSRRVKLSGTVLSEEPVQFVEVLVNGKMQKRIALQSKRNRNGAYEAKFKIAEDISGTSWVALRCWEDRADGRVRFAHTAPTWFDDTTLPLRPRRVEVQWLAERMRQEVISKTDVLSPEAVAEYQEALKHYESLEQTAR